MGGRGGGRGGARAGRGPSADPPTRPLTTLRSPHQNTSGGSTVNTERPKAHPAPWQGLQRCPSSSGGYRSQTPKNGASSVPPEVQGPVAR
eukprot:15458185-Alexandrium_andersonii.AAC.1